MMYMTRSAEPKHTRVWSGVSNSLRSWCPSDRNVFCLPYSPSTHFKTKVLQTLRLPDRPARISNPLDRTHFWRVLFNIKISRSVAMFAGEELDKFHKFTIHNTKKSYGSHLTSIPLTCPFHLSWSELLRPIKFSLFPHIRKIRQEDFPPTPALDGGNFSEHNAIFLVQYSHLSPGSLKIH